MQILAENIGGMLRYSGMCGLQVSDSFMWLSGEMHTATPLLPEANLSMVSNPHAYISRLPDS